jgi:hypothetical protein
LIGGRRCKCAEIAELTRVLVTLARAVLATKYPPAGVVHIGFF